MDQRIVRQLRSLAEHLKAPLDEESSLESLQDFCVDTGEALSEVADWVETLASPDPQSDRDRMAYAIAQMRLQAFLDNPESVPEELEDPARGVIQASICFGFMFADEFERAASGA